jgi:hypothetical protein
LLNEILKASLVTVVNIVVLITSEKSTLLAPFNYFWFNHNYQTTVALLHDFLTDLRSLFAGTNKKLTRVQSAEKMTFKKYLLKNEIINHVYASRYAGCSFIINLW